MQVAGDQVASSLRVGRGALVQAVEPSSSAAKAGLQGIRRTLSGIAAGKLYQPAFMSLITPSRGLFAELTASRADDDSKHLMSRK